MVFISWSDPRDVNKCVFRLWVLMVSLFFWLRFLLFVISCKNIYYLKLCRAVFRLPILSRKPTSWIRYTWFLHSIEKCFFFVISRSNKSNSAFLKVKWSYKEFFHSHHSLQTALLFSQIPAAIQITKYEAFLNMWVIFKAAKTLWKVFIKETKIEICSREIMSNDSS